MKVLKYFIALYMSTTILFTNCKSTKTVQKDLLKPMPETFALSKDSLNSGNINWKEYFTDKNLTSLIDIALTNNIDLLIALQKIETARANLRLSKNAFLPSVSAVGMAAQRKFGLYTMDGAGNITTEITPGRIVPIHLPDYYLGLQTAWEIDVWGKLRNKKKAALARYLGSVEGRNLIITNLISEIANSYYDLLALDNELEIVRETIKLQDDALSIVKIQKQSAYGNELAVKQFEAQSLNSKALEIEVLQEITELENKINFLLGRYPQQINRDKTDFTKAIPIQVKIGIPSDLLKNRPDIRQAEFELVASKADVKAARAAFYPSFNITGGIGFQAFKTGLLFTNPQSMAYSLIGTLVAPLINRSAIKAEFRNANTYQLEALYNYQKSIINGYIEVNNQVSRIKSLEQIQKFKTAETDALIKSIEVSSELFKTGRANYLEVLLTQKNAFITQLELIETKKRQYNAVIDIYKALGGGWK